MSKKCFITGSTGFVGMNIITLLMKERVFDEVHCLHRPNSSLKATLEKLVVDYEKEGPEEKVKIILCAGDVTDIHSLRKGIPEGTDCVFHLAGLADYYSRNKDHLMKVNYEGTKFVAKVCKEKGVKKVIHCGSTSIYGRSALSGPDGKVPLLSEKSPKLGKEADIMYWKTKGLADEYMCGLMNEMEIVTVNPPRIMGPFDTAGAYRVFQLIKDDKLPIIPRGFAPYAYSKEVAKCFVNAYKVAKPGSEYLLGGTNISFLELAQEIARELGSPIPRKETALWIINLIGRAYDLWGMITSSTYSVSRESMFLANMKYDVDCSKAEKELGFVKTPLKEMVKNAADYFRRNQWKEEEDSKKVNKS